MSRVVVVGPMPPLRGGIAAHGARLVEALRANGIDAGALSYRRLYPRLVFPGRSEREAVPRPDWCRELLDTLDPASWRRAALDLAGADLVLLQWWHPVVAPALLVATAGLPPERLVALCHNVQPHEWFPASAMAARRLLGRCGRVLCHSSSEAARLRDATGIDGAVAPLPSLLPESAWKQAAPPPELRSLAVSQPLFAVVGHRRLYKDVEGTIRAWSRARKPAEARLVVAGECYLRGRARQRLLGLLATDPSITVIDRYVTDQELAWILARADALLAVPCAASQSGVVATAAAAGVPLVLGTAGGLAEQAGPGASFVEDGQALRLEIERRLVSGRRRDDRGAFDAERFTRAWRRIIEAIGVVPRP